MTPDELREAVASAIEDTWRRGPIDCADAALRVVREAMREPTPQMASAANCRPRNAEGFYLEWNPWRAMFDASPLGENAE